MEPKVIYADPSKYPTPLIPKIKGLYSPVPTAERPKPKNEPKFISAAEVSSTLGVSRATAYRIISELNDQLKSKGYLTIPGKVSRRFFLEKIYA